MAHWSSSGTEPHHQPQITIILLQIPSQLYNHKDFHNYIITHTFTIELFISETS